VQISAPAKVNLFLEILSKRTDGFHELATVMTSVSLFDQIQFSPNESGKIQLKILSSEMGMDVVLDKQIPAAAGLGGASSNAAAAIVAGDLAWRLGLSVQDRGEVAAEIGSDVPFFLYGGTALCTGRGEKVQPVEAPHGIALVIAKPVCGLSTPAVFRECVVPDSPVEVDEFLEVVTHGNPEKIADSMHNRLQPIAESMEQEVLALAQAFDNPDWEVFNVQSLGQNDVIAA